MRTKYQKYLIKIIYHKFIRKVREQNPIQGRYRPYESCDFTRSNYLIYIKSGKNRENLQKSGTFTWSVLTLYSLPLF